MREIKFRAWDKKDNKMYPVWSMDFDTGFFTVDNKFIPRSVILKIGVERKYPFFELMQFTGLHDKSGKEIYEGDVIYFEGHSKIGEFGHMGYHEVYFNEHTSQFGFVGWNKSFTPFFGYASYATTDSGGICHVEETDFSKIEVLGNIYENPELLEAK